MRRLLFVAAVLLGAAVALYVYLTREVRAIDFGDRED